MQTENRREFLRHALRASGAFVLGTVTLGAWSKRRSKMNNTELIVKDAVLDCQYSADPARLLAEFHIAESKDLMRRYSIGFTSILIAAETADVEWRHNILKDTEALAANKYNKELPDRHRIKAFPAAFSTHILPFSKDRDLLCAGEMIADSLSWPQREVQEIVCQNLVCSLTRDFHTWEELWLSNIVLDEIAEYVLVRRHHNPLLNTGSSIALQFLSYYELALLTRKLATSQRETAHNQLKKIEEIFRKIFDAKDTYAWFVQSWLTELQQLCKQVRLKDKSKELFRSLPPQLSELVMGWRHFSDLNHPWFRILTLAVRNQALLLHFNRQIVSGSASDTLLNNMTQQEYGIREAKVAIGKSEAWFKDMAIRDIIFLEAKRGCTTDYEKTLNDVARKTSTRNTGLETHPDWSLVPFRDFQNPLPRIDRCPSSEWIDNLLLLMAGGFSGKLVSELFQLADIHWSASRERTPPEIDQDVRPSKESVEEALSSQKALETINDMKGLLDGKPTALWHDEKSIKKEVKENSKEETDPEANNANAADAKSRAAD